MSKLLRAVIGVIVFVIAFWLIALAIGGIASLAGFGIGGIEATIIAVVAAVVTVLVMRWVPIGSSPWKANGGG